MTYQARKMVLQNSMTFLVCGCSSAAATQVHVEQLQEHTVIDGTTTTTTTIIIIIISSTVVVKAECISN